jgi:hypothetical protein
MVPAGLRVGIVSPARVDAGDWVGESPITAVFPLEQALRRRNRIITINLMSLNLLPRCEDGSSDGGIMDNS